MDKHGSCDLQLLHLFLFCRAKNAKRTRDRDRDGDGDKEIEGERERERDIEEKDRERQAQQDIGIDGHANTRGQGEKTWRGDGQGWPSAFPRAFPQEQQQQPRDPTTVAATTAATETEMFSQQERTCRRKPKQMLHCMYAHRSTSLHSDRIPSFRRRCRSAIEEFCTRWHAKTLPITIHWPYITSLKNH